MLMAFGYTCAYCQVVTVFDKATREPVPGVVIQVMNKAAIFTDADGKADVSQLAGEDSVFISYSNYK